MFWLARVLASADATPPHERGGWAQTLCFQRVQYVVEPSIGRPESDRSGISVVIGTSVVQSAASFLEPDVGDGKARSNKM